VAAHKERATQIRDAYGFVEFTAAAKELARWVEDRAWTSGDGPKTLFGGAMTRRALRDPDSSDDEEGGGGG